MYIIFIKEINSYIIEIYFGLRPYSSRIDEYSENRIHEQYKPVLIYYYKH